MPHIKKYFRDVKLASIMFTLGYIFVSSQQKEWVREDKFSFKESFSFSHAV